MEGGLWLRIDMNDEQVRELVDKLANDDDFRAELAADPAGVLAGYGIEGSEEFFTAPVELAPKEEVQKLAQRALDREVIRVEAGPALLFPIFCATFSWPALSQE